MLGFRAVDLVSALPSVDACQGDRVDVGSDWLRPSIFARTLHHKASGVADVGVLRGSVDKDGGGWHTSIVEYSQSLVIADSR